MRATLAKKGLTPFKIGMSALGQKQPLGCPRTNDRWGKADIPLTKDE